MSGLIHDKGSHLQAWRAGKESRGMALGKSNTYKWYHDGVTCFPSGSGKSCNVHERSESLLTSMSHLLHDVGVGIYLWRP